MIFWQRIERGMTVSIESISMKINGADVSLANITESQLLNVIKALNETKEAQPIKAIEIKKSAESVVKPAAKKMRSRRSRIRATIDNYQFDKSVTPITNKFDIESALNLKVLFKSFDSGKDLSHDSKQLKARREIIWIFASNSNQPMRVNEVCESLCESLDLSPPAASNYLSQCARLGVLAKAKDEDDVVYFISAWFIGQLSSLNNLVKE